MYPLFETIKVLNGNAVNLHYHQERMESACLQLFENTCNFSLAQIVNCPDSLKNRLVKCRIRYNAFDYVIQFADYKYQKASSYKLVEISDLDYSLKFTDRSVINDLIEDADDFDDIILVKNGLITDSSYANLVFEKDGMRYTPEYPLLKGTKRQYYLDQNLIQTANISLQNIDQYDKVCRINAMIELEDAEWVKVSQIDMSDFI